MCQGGDSDAEHVGEKEVGESENGYQEATERYASWTIGLWQLVQDRIQFGSLEYLTESWRG